MKRLTAKEMENIEEVLKMHGKCLDGGSTEEMEDGSTVYYLNIRSYYGVGTFGSKMGQQLRTALGAAKVFIGGKQVA